MANTYKTKQAVIDEQAQQVEDLAQQVKDLKGQLMLKESIHENSVRRIQEEARKFSDVIGAEASITVCEDTYMADTPATVLASVQVFEELFDDEVGGEMKTDLLKEMDKLSEALSEFYSAFDQEVRINMSINRY